MGEFANLLKALKPKVASSHAEAWRKETGACLLMPGGTAVKPKDVQRAATDPETVSKASGPWVQILAGGVPAAVCLALYYAFDGATAPCSTDLGQWLFYTGAIGCAVTVVTLLLACIGTRTRKKVSDEETGERAMKKEETGQYGMLGCMLGCVLGMRMLGCVLGMFSLIWYIIGHVRLWTTNPCDYMPSNVASGADNATIAGFAEEDCCDPGLYHAVWGYILFTCAFARTCTLRMERSDHTRSSLTLTCRLVSLAFTICCLPLCICCCAVGASAKSAASTLFF